MACLRHVNLETVLAVETVDARLAELGHRAMKETIACLQNWQDALYLSIFLKKKTYWRAAEDFLP